MQLIVELGICGSSTLMFALFFDLAIKLFKELYKPYFIIIRFFMFLGSVCLGLFALGFLLCAIIVIIDFYRNYKEEARMSNK